MLPASLVGSMPSALTQFARPPVCFCRRRVSAVRGHAAAHAACPAHGKRSAPALLRHEFVHIMIDVACKSRGEHGQRSRALSMATSVLLLQERFRRSELRCRAWLVLVLPSMRDSSCDDASCKACTQSLLILLSFCSFQSFFFRSVLSCSMCSRSILSINQSINLFYSLCSFMFILCSYDHSFGRSSLLIQFDNRVTYA